MSNEHNLKNDLEIEADVPSLPPPACPPLSGPHGRLAEKKLVCVLSCGWQTGQRAFVGAQAWVWKAGSLPTSALEAEALVPAPHTVLRRAGPGRPGVGRRCSLAPSTRGGGCAGGALCRWAGPLSTHGGGQECAWKDLEALWLPDAGLGARRCVEGPSPPQDADVRLEEVSLSSRLVPAQPSLTSLCTSER